MEWSSSVRQFSQIWLWKIIGKKGKKNPSIYFIFGLPTRML
jgi:hypothetical protein